MSSDATTAVGLTHPEWCDPREHWAWTPDDHDHRDEPTVIELPIGSLTTQRTQFENPVVQDSDHEHLRLVANDGEVTASVDLHLGDLDTLIADLIERRAMIRGY
jgi:hypothetical protein